MTDYCVVQFCDESWTRIAPTELIKLQNNRKFVPVSARDLPDQKVRVKWQESQSGSFSSDGYFDADVLAIAGSVKTAMAKALEMGRKLAPNPVLALPSAMPAVPSSNRRRSRDPSKKQNSPLKNPPNKDSASNQSSNNTLKREDTTSQTAAPGSSSKPTFKALKKSSQDKIKNPTDGKVKDGSRKRKKRLKLDAVGIERSKAQLEKSVQENPILKGRNSDKLGNETGPVERKQSASNILSSAVYDDETEKKLTLSASGKHEDPKSKKKSIVFVSNATNVVKPDEVENEPKVVSGGRLTVEDIDDTKNTTVVGDGKYGTENVLNPDEISLTGSGDEIPFVSLKDDDDEIDAGESEVGVGGAHGGAEVIIESTDSEDGDSGMFENTKALKDTKGKMQVVGDDGSGTDVENQDGAKVGGRDELSDNDDDLDETLPVNNLSKEIEDMAESGSSEDSDSSSSSSCSESASEDETAKLAACNLKLKHEALKLKAELQKVKAEFDETKRNMTLANNLRLAHRDELTSVKKELGIKEKLIKSLETRNETLQDLLCEKTAGSKHQKCINIVKKDSSADKKFKLQVSPVKRQDSISSHTESVKKLIVKKETSSDKKIEKSPSPVKKKHGTSERKPIYTLSSTPDKSRSGTKIDCHNESMDNDSLEVTNLSNISPSPRKRHSGDSESTTPEKKNSKRKKRNRSDELDNEEIESICQNVLQHLKKEVPLEEDKKGFVNLGLNVRVDKGDLEKTLKDHKGDVQKICKNLAAITWTSSERLERSLEGGVSNRFPNAPPKKAATPRKVHACLGVVKAHLLHAGDNDGPGLKENLKMARRAIGHKFAQDISLAKKRGDIQ